MRGSGATGGCLEHLCCPQMKKMDMGIEMIEKLQEEINQMKRLMTELGMGMIMLTMVTESSIRELEERLKNQD